MKRKSSLPLVLGAVFGVAATVALVVLLFGGNNRSARTGKADSSANAEPPRTPRTFVHRTPDREPIDVDRILRKVPKREPFDSPDMIAQRAQESARVLELVEEFRTAAPEDSAKRRALFKELGELVRKLGHRLDRGVRDDLIRLLVDGDALTSRLVGETIGYMKGDKETAQILMELSQQKPKSVPIRQGILTALGNMQVKEMLPELIGALGQGYEDENLIVRAIGRLGGPGVGAKLLDRLGKPILPGTRAALPDEHDEVDRGLEVVAGVELLDDDEAGAAFRGLVDDRVVEADRRLEAEVLLRPIEEVGDALERVARILPEVAKQLGYVLDHVVDPGGRRSRPEPG